MYREGDGPLQGLCVGFDSLTVHHFRKEAMDNQHKLIKGYRDLSQEEIDLMNEGKALAEQVGHWVLKLQQASDTDKRWANIGATDLQKGFMSAIRSIARPTTF